MAVLYCSYIYAENWIFSNGPYFLKLQGVNITVNCRIFRASRAWPPGSPPALCQEAYCAPRSLGLVYTISDYVSCQIVFMNPIQKTLWSVSVYTKICVEFREQSEFCIHAEPCKQNPNAM